MQERIMRIALPVAVILPLLSGCAWLTRHHVPDEMIAAPEPAPDLVAVILAGDLERADQLVGIGADVDQKGQNGTTPLIAAAMTGANELAATLIRMGAHSEAKDASGKNALAYALEANNEELVTMLVEQAKRAF